MLWVSSPGWGWVKQEIWSSCPHPGPHISPVQHSGGVWSGGSCKLLSGPLHMDRKPSAWETGLVTWEMLLLVTHPPQVCPKCSGFGGAQRGLKEGFLCFRYEHMVPAAGRKSCTALRS